MQHNKITKLLVLASSICLVTLLLLYRSGKLRYSFPGDKYAEMLQAEPLPVPMLKDTTIPKKAPPQKVLLLPSSKSMMVVPVDNPLFFPPKTKKKEPAALKTMLSSSKSGVIFKSYTPPVIVPLDSIKIDTSLLKLNHQQ